MRFFLLKRSAAWKSKSNSLLLIDCQCDSDHHSNHLQIRKLIAPYIYIACKLQVSEPQNDAFDHFVSAVFWSFSFPKLHPRHNYLTGCTEQWRWHAGSMSLLNDFMFIRWRVQVRVAPIITCNVSVFMSRRSCDYHGRLQTGLPQLQDNCHSSWVQNRAHWMW